MVECNFSNIYRNINDQQQFRINEISKIRDYVNADIKEIQLISKKLSKYVVSFDYFDRSLIVLSAESSRISIGSFASVIGASIGIASASYSFAFSIFTDIVKKLLKIARNKKKKHSKVVMLGRTKLNSIESKISEALINSKINHENFTRITNEETLKKVIRMMKEVILKKII